VPQPVYLVRHGQSQWNLLRLTQGQIHHPPLTALGRAQAARAAETIAADLPRGAAVRLVTSDLVRAAETAAIIGERLGVEPVPDVRLREQGFGDLEGRGYDVARAVLAAHDWADPTARPAGGESVREVHDRVARALAEHDGRRTGTAVVVAVSHGDTIRAAVALPTCAPHEPGWLEVPNGAVARIDGPGAISWLG
jgi:probable phosphoglycerate mutase